MKNRTLSTFVAVVGLLSLQVQADQTSVPKGNWFGDITSKCTMSDALINDWNLRNPQPLSLRYQMCRDFVAKTIVSTGPVWLR